MALTLDKIRELNPHYADVDDSTLAEYLHERYRPNEPFKQFAKTIGYEDPNAEGDTVRGFKDTFRQLPQEGYGLAAAVGATAENVAGEGGIATWLKNFGLEGYRRTSQDMAENAKESDSLTYSWDKAKQGDFGALVDWLQYGIGYAGGQGLQMLATAGIGSAVAKGGVGLVAKETAEKMVSREAAKIAATDAGKALSADAIQAAAVANVADKLAKVGSTAAIGASAFGMEGGEIGGGMVDQADKKNRKLTGDDLAKAFGATLGAGALEFVGDKFGLDVLTGKSGVFKAADRIKGKTGMAARGLLGGIAAAPAEGATEYGQTLAEEYGKGNDPFSDESRQQAIDAAGMGALGGGAMGGVGGLLRRPKVDPVDISPIARAGSVDEAIEAAGEIVSAPELTYQRKLTEPNQRGNVSADAVINFPDGSTTSAYDYFEQRLAAHGDENRARQEMFQALNGPAKPYAGPRLLEDSGIIFAGQDNPEARDPFEGERFQNDNAFDDSVPFDTQPRQPAGPTWEEVDIANEMARRPELTPQQIEARKRLDALRSKKTTQDQTPEPQATAATGVQPQEGGVSPQFRPTHTLSDGTPVVATDEPNVWFDGTQEFEDEYAEPINANSDSRVNATPDIRTTAANRGAGNQDSGTGGVAVSDNQQSSNNEVGGNDRGLSAGVAGDAGNREPGRALAGFTPQETAEIINSGAKNLTGYARTRFGNERVKGRDLNKELEQLNEQSRLLGNPVPREENKTDGAAFISSDLGVPAVLPGYIGQPIENVARKLGLPKDFYEFVTTGVGFERGQKTGYHTVSDKYRTAELTEAENALDKAIKSKASSQVRKSAEERVKAAVRSIVDNINNDKQNGQLGFKVKTSSGYLKDGITGKPIVYKTREEAQAAVDDKRRDWTLNATAWNSKRANSKLEIEELNGKSQNQATQATAAEEALSSKTIPYESLDKNDPLFEKKNLLRQLKNTVNNGTDPQGKPLMGTALEDSYKKAIAELEGEIDKQQTKANQAQPVPPDARTDTSGNATPADSGAGQSEVSKQKAGKVERYAENGTRLSRLKYRRIDQLENKVAKLEAEQERLSEASANTPGVFTSGRGNLNSPAMKSLQKRRGQLNDKQSSNFAELQKAKADLKALNEWAKAFEAGEVHDNGQPRADAPSKQEAKQAEGTYADYIRARVKPGDVVTFNPNPQLGGVKVKSLNKATVTIESGSKYQYFDIAPMIDGRDMTKEELRQDIKDWRESIKQPSNTQPAETKASGDKSSYGKIKQQAYSVANGFFGKDIISQSIQNDWQRLLDAIDSKNLDLLEALAKKYAKDEGRDGMGSGTSGAGPGKVKTARAGAAQIPRFAREAAKAIREEQASGAASESQSNKSEQEKPKPKHRIIEKYAYQFERGLQEGAANHALSMGLDANQTANRTGFYKDAERNAFIKGFDLANTGEYYDQWRAGANLTKVAESRGDVEVKRKQEASNRVPDAKDYNNDWRKDWDVKPDPVNSKAEEKPTTVDNKAGELQEIFTGLGKDKQAKAADIDHADAELIANVQNHWHDILAEHGYIKTKDGYRDVAGNAIDQPKQILINGKNCA